MIRPSGGSPNGTTCTWVASRWIIRLRVSAPGTPAASRSGSGSPVRSASQVHSVPVRALIETGARCSDTQRHTLALVRYPVPSTSSPCGCSIPNRRW